jgi:predicted N-acetyltransferase YhbS
LAIFSAMDAGAIEFRRLAPAEVSRVGEIDRTERIESLYVQHGTRLEKRAGDWSSPPWDPEGEGEHSVAHLRTFCERHIQVGAVALGAFDGGRMVGMGLVTPHVRPGIAQLAFLHVSDGYRGRGIGARLTEEMERIACAEGDAAMVVSATPSENTVRFYLSRGYEPTAEPLPELFALEPEDVHMEKPLQGQL